MALASMSGNAACSPLADGAACETDARSGRWLNDIVNWVRFTKIQQKTVTRTLTTYERWQSGMVYFRNNGKAGR